MTRLLRLDILALLLTSLVTAGVLVVGAERVAKLVFFQTGLDICEASHAMANCTGVFKLPEGPLVVNQYNDCGYRTAESCGSKPANGIRVAIVGTSISRGYGVAYGETIGAVAAAELSELCARPVEFQNVSYAWRERGGAIWDQFEERVDEAFALKPDALMFVVAPWDLWKYNNETSVSYVLATRRFSRLPFYDELHAAAEALRNVRENSRAVLALRHLIYLDPDVLVEQYLRTGDQSDYLRVPFTEAWRVRLAFLTTRLEQISSKTAKQGIPMILVYVPFAPQALLAASADLHSGVDPFAFDRAVGAAAARYGIQFIDVLPPMSRQRRPADMYYSVNGHPNGAGDAVIARTIVSEIIKNTIFSSCKAKSQPNAEGTSRGPAG